MDKMYTSARILVGTGDVSEYSIKPQAGFIAAVREANKVVATLQEKTSFNVRLVEVK
jgi:hypothetical protein